MVEAHAGAPPALDDEQKRALLPNGAAHRREEGGAERDDQSHQPREHLVHLREIERLPGRQGGGQPPSQPGAASRDETAVGKDRDESTYGGPLRIDDPTAR